VLENLASVSGGPCRQFLVPGIMIENVVLTAPVTALALIRDADTGLADRFRSLPMSRSAVLVGRLLSDAVVFFVQALTICECVVQRFLPGPLPGSVPVT